MMRHVPEVWLATSEGSEEDSHPRRVSPTLQPQHSPTSEEDSSSPDVPSDSLESSRSFLLLCSRWGEVLKQFVTFTLVWIVLTDFYILSILSLSYFSHDSYVQLIISLNSQVIKLYHFHIIKIINTVKFHIYQHFDEEQLPKINIRLPNTWIVAHQSPPKGLPLLFVLTCAFLAPVCFGSPASGLPASSSAHPLTVINCCPLRQKHFVPVQKTSIL